MLPADYTWNSMDNFNLDDYLRLPSYGMILTDSPLQNVMATSCTQLLSLCSMHMCMHYRIIIDQVYGFIQSDRYRCSLTNIHASVYLVGSLLIKLIQGNVHTTTATI